MRTATWMLATALAVTLLCAPPAGAQQATADLSDREATKLAESLSAMGMTELLEALIERNPSLRDTPAGLALQAEARLAEARRVSAEQQDDDALRRRRELLVEAAELFARAADATAGATSDEATIDHFRYRLKRIETLGIHLPRSAMVRLMFLRGGPADREQALEQTELPAQLIESYLLDMEDTLQQWRQDLVKLATVMPELQAVRRAAQYRAGWVRFYRGAVLSRDDERSRRQRERLLGDAVEAVREFATGDADSGVKYPSLLLSGMAARELDRHRQAAELLSAADDRAAAPAVRMQAEFEKARNAVEGATDPETGLSAINTFRGELSELLGTDAAAQVDLHATMLREHLFRTLAAAARAGDDAEKVRDYAARAEDALLAFLEDHPDSSVQKAFLEIVARKHAGDEAAGGPIVLLARAEQAPPEQAEELLTRLLSQEAEAAERIRPLALWQMGLLESRRGRAREAGEYFLQLAQGHADHRLALPAAQNAAATYNRIVAALNQAGESVGTELRRKLIEILRVVTEGWPDEPEAARWNFDLGWQLQQLAPSTEEPLQTMQRAVAAYQRVPDGLEESMEAAFLALQLRVEMLETADRPADERQRRAEALVGDLADYARRAADKVASAGEQQADDLRRWGAEADFLAARVQYEVLNRRDEALAELRKLPDRWPGGEALRRAAEFEIRKLVETGRTQEAIDRVEAFRQAYPREARELVHLVAWQVRRRLREMETRTDASQQRQELRQVFLRFASDLYTRTEELPPQERYPYIQMHAQALLANGRPQQAMELFRRCRELDDRRRQENPDLAVDAANIRGLARAQHALGNHADAAELYADLVRGMEASDELYWPTELEYCRCLLEAHRDNPPALRRLLIRIRQLRGEQRRMGGLAGRFEEVEEQAERALGSV
jgi:hypothetical protein